MKNMLEYKDYHAKIEFDKEDMLFVGSVFGIQDSLNFHGTTIQELVDNFHQSIDNYLEMCQEFGRKPDKEFKGSFNVRIDQELHREAAFAADRSGMTLNQYRRLVRTIMVPFMLLHLRSHILHIKKWSLEK